MATAFALGSDLPEGWRWRFLGEALPLEYGKALPAKARSGTGQTIVYGSSGPVGEHSASFLDGPAVIVGRKGSAGAVHYCAGPCWPIDTAYYVRLPDDVDPRFAYLLLSHLRLDKLDQSTAIPSLSRDTYGALVAPFPEIEAQRRIAARVDELFTELNDGEEELRRARAELETYRKSLLKAAVTGELTADWRAANSPQESGAELIQRILADRRARWEADPKNRGKRYKEPEEAEGESNLKMPAGWVCAAVGQLGEVVTGATPATSRPDYYGGNVPFFTPSDLEGCVVSTTKRTLTEAGRDSVRSVPAGSVLVTCIGATIGKLALAGASGATNQQINSVVPGEAPLSHWIHAFLSSPWGQHEIVDRSSSTTLPILNKGDFSRVPVPLPPMAEIKQLCARLEARLEERRELANGLHELRSEPDILRQSILAAAFRGELVQ